MAGCEYHSWIDPGGLDTVDVVVAVGLLCRTDRLDGATIRVALPSTSIASTIEWMQRSRALISSLSSLSILNHAMASICVESTIATVPHRARA